MLIFTKKIGETFVTNSYTAVTVLGIKEDRVKLGIDSPTDIPAHRKVISQYIKTGLDEVKKTFFTLLDDSRKTKKDDNSL